MEELFDGLLNDHLGFVVWATVAFIILIFLLGKLAWKPIIGAIAERERSIEDALQRAESAKVEVARLTSENELLLRETRAERDLILKEAKAMKDSIVSEAKKTAQVEGAKMIERAKVEIENQKNVALAEVKSQVAELSLEIAEKVLQSHLDDRKKQDKLVADLLQEVTL
ncbi:MAG: F0F1 ATP synthase subunit B [Sphingobacteriaceae bacterium]